MYNSTLALVPSSGDTPTSAAASVIRAVPARNGVRFVKWVAPLAMRFRGVRFELHIRRVMQVLGMGNKLQVVRPHTTWSDARVVNLQSLWDGADRKKIGKAMAQICVFPLRIGTSGSEVPVSTWEFPALPQPTVSGLIHLVPEAFCKRAAELFWAQIHQRVAVAAKPLKVHPAQTTALNGLQTIKDHALHVSTLPHCAVRGSR